MSERADEIEILRRTGLVEAAILAGTTSREIELHYAEEWGVTTRQVRTYISKAKEAILADQVERNAQSRDEARAKYRAQLEFMQEKSAIAGRFDWALAALKEVGKFDGLDTGESGTVVNVVLPEWALRAGIEPPKLPGDGE